MPVETKRRFLVGSGKRRVLSVAVALGTATILGTVGVGGGVANADLLCGVPTSQADSGPEVDAIKQLKTSYFQNIDAKNWDALREFLDPLIVVDTTCSAGPILTGRDPFIAFLQLTLGGANTHHQGSDHKST